VLPWPPQPTMPPVAMPDKTTMPSMIRRRRLRDGRPSINMQATVTPPAMDQRVPGRAGTVVAPVVGALVLMVRVAEPAIDPVMLTGLLEPKLSVGRFAAPEGLDVRAAVSATLPVNPLVGLTVMVVEFPLVAPRANERLAEPGLSVRPGVGGAPVETTRFTEEPAVTAVPPPGL